eukprot:1847720-Rhodomonas_salina.1
MTRTCHSLSHVTPRDPRHTPPRDPRDKPRALHALPCDQCAPQHVTTRHVTIACNNQCQSRAALSRTSAQC